MSDSEFQKKSRGWFAIGHYYDPWFWVCLRESVMTPGMLENFDRLYGASLATNRAPIERMIDEATGKAADDMRAFVRFVKDFVYDLTPHPRTGVS